ncbi:hypothetical protein RSAG8_10873, partial [Rhizoctonia solani AG-8 WAC10335]
MPASQVSLSTQNISGDNSLHSRLLNLYSSLRNLPETLSNHPDIYPFAEKFALNQHDIEFYGSHHSVQHYKREEARTISLPPSRPFRPPVRSANLTPAAQILTPDCSSTESEDPASTYNGAGSQDDVQETTVVGSRHYFEVEHEDGVFLASKMLSEALFDHTNASQKLP